MWIQQLFRHNIERLRTKMHIGTQWTSISPVVSNKAFGVKSLKLGLQRSILARLLKELTLIMY
jgi:hypothetical protein